MSVITIHELSTTVDRVVQRITIADTKVTRLLAVLLVLGSSALVGLLALAALMCVLGGAYFTALITVAIAVVVGAPAVIAFAWLEQTAGDRLF